MLAQLQVYQTKQYILKGLLEQLSGEEIYQVVENVNNSIYWLVGHMTGARLSMLKLLDIEYKLDLDLQPFRKSASSSNISDGPEFSVMLKHFDKMGDMLYENLQNLDTNVLGRPMKYIISDKMVTVGDNLRFLIFHEDYHIGQIALIIRMKGKKGIGV